MTTELTKIEQLKRVNGIDVTSEYVLGVTDPIEYQCSKIDEMVKNISSIYKDIDRARDSLKDEEYDDATGYLDSAAFDLSTFDDEIEEMRTAIEAVRQWGQEWKDLAKSVINSSDRNIEDLI